MKNHKVLYLLTLTIFFITYAPTVGYCAKFSTGGYESDNKEFMQMLQLNPSRSGADDRYSILIKAGNTEGGEGCEFSGNCYVQNGKLICINPKDFNKNKSEYVVIDNSDSNSLEIIKSYRSMCSKQAPKKVSINGKYCPVCLNEKLESKAVTGVYLGFKKSEYTDDYIEIELKNSNDKLMLTVPQSEASRIFGEKKGQPVLANYDIERYSSFGECAERKVLKSVKFLNSNKIMYVNKLYNNFYECNEPDFKGEITLSWPKENFNGTYYIDISTMNSEGYDCQFQGTCKRKNGQLICIDEEQFKEDNNNYIEISISNNNLEVIKGYQVGICGLHGYITGRYIPVAK